MQYEPRPTNIEVIQLQTAVTIDYDGNNGAIIQAVAGDYLVQDGDKLFVLNPEEFHKRYRPVKPYMPVTNIRTNTLPYTSDAIFTTNGQTTVIPR